MIWKPTPKIFGVTCSLNYYCGQKIDAVKNCDPPQENRGKGDDTGTRAMTRHAERVTIAEIDAYLMSKTKRVMVDIVWQPKAFVSSSEQKNTLNVQLDTRVNWHTCDKTQNIN